MYGSVQYDTVVSRFSTFSIRVGGGGRVEGREIGCRNVVNISVLNHEG